MASSSSSAAAASQAAPTVGQVLSSYKLTKATAPGKLVIGRFDRFDTVVSERLPDGKRVTKRLKKLRPDLDQCPNGLAMTDSTNHDKTPVILLGHTTDVVKPAVERPLGAEVYEGEEERMPARHLLLRRVVEGGTARFEVSVVHGWHSFVKATTVAAPVDDDPDAAEKAFEQHQANASRRRSRLAEAYARLAEKQGTELADLEGDAERAMMDVEATGEGGVSRTLARDGAARGVVQLGGLCVREKFTRVQVDEDERYDEGYRASFQADVDRKTGKMKRRLGYSGIHGADRAVAHDGMDHVDDDDAELRGDMSAAQQAEEAIFTQFDDDDDLGAEAALLQLNEGTGAADEGGAEVVESALVGGGDDDDDDGGAADDDDAAEEGIQASSKMGLLASASSAVPTAVELVLPRLACARTTPQPLAPIGFPTMRTIGTLFMTFGMLALARAATIALHATTQVVFPKISFGVTMGVFDIVVADQETATMMCRAPEAPVAMVAGCLVGGKVACDSQSSMMAFTSVQGHAGNVRMTLEAASVAVADGGIIIDQRVVCDVQRTRRVDNDRAVTPQNTSAFSTAATLDAEEIQGSGSFVAAGSDQVLVAPVAKHFKENVVATADSIGPLSSDISVDVHAVDASGAFCAPTSSLPFLVVEDASSQEGPLACVPIKNDACGALRCTLPWTATRLSVTLRPSDSNAFSHDPLFAQVLVVPSASP